MDIALALAMLAFGLLVGASCSWLVMRLQTAREADAAVHAGQIEIAQLKAEVHNQRAAASELPALRQQLTTLTAAEASLRRQLEVERQQWESRTEEMRQAEQRLTTAFKVLSTDALKSSNEEFLKLAKASLATFQEGAKGDLEKRQLAIDALVKPIEKSLKAVDEKIQSTETERLKSYSSLSQQVKDLILTQTELRNETGKLVTALRSPIVRGRWGEVQLKRVVELSGMLNHCDFFEQVSVASNDGTLRPDLVVQLPGNKQIVVDAKAPLAAYLEAIEATDAAVRIDKMKDHARQIRVHIDALCKKQYHAQFDSTPEFVVLFLPGEVFFSAALEHDPTLIEVGAERNVIISTPTTLIALLRAVRYGWNQESIAQNAKDICTLGRELHDRLSTLGDRLVKLGKQLEGATKCYNEAIGSIENRVFVTARKFRELDAGDSKKDIPVAVAIEVSPRPVSAIELVSGVATRRSEPAGEAIEAD
jgi:DNA recombination protein RmuC